MTSLCSMCCGSTAPPNFQKQINPIVNPQGFMTDSDSSKDSRRALKRGGTSTIQLCFPTGGGAGMGGWILGSKPKDREPSPQQGLIVHMPNDIPFSCPKFICEPCPPSPPTKVWLIKSSPTPQKAVCLPAPAPVKIMLCLSCPPHLGVQRGEPNLQGQNRMGHSNQQEEVAPSAFCVPAKCDSRSSKNGKYLPPPEKRNCPPNCIHVSDIKESRACTFYSQVPCVAHCYDTPLKKG